MTPRILIEDKEGRAHANIFSTALTPQRNVSQYIYKRVRKRESEKGETEKCYKVRRRGKEVIHDISVYIREIYAVH